MIHVTITSTNVLERSAMELTHFLNTHVLVHKIPQYTPNHPLTVKNDIVPLLGLYANSRAYVTELFNIVITAYYEQKAFKKQKSDHFNDVYYSSLENKKEVLYRTAQALDRLYEAASRLMTGIGQPDSNMGRYV